MIYFTDEEILESYLEEIIERRRDIKRWPYEDYPHAAYDYSTDDSGNFDYRQDFQI